jgi:hypothetical protein
VYREKPYEASNGFVALFILLFVLLAGAAAMVREFRAGQEVLGVLATLVVLITAFLLAGLFIVQPNEARRWCCLARIRAPCAGMGSGLRIRF